MMKTILITGAASGLGKALALRYAKAGFEVCVADLNALEGEKVAQSIVDAGGAAFFHSCDVTQQSDVDGLVAEIKTRWQSLDILVNNAGVATAGMLAHEDMEAWQWVMNINLLGHVRMSKAFVPLIKASSAEQRAIINIASQAGLTAVPGMGSYCASKAAMVSFSESLFLELSHDDIHVSVICPAFFDTNLDKSLRSNQQGMDQVVTKLLKKSGISADQIAAKVFDQSHNGKFMIVTHSQGRNAFLLKRFLPMNWYLKIVKKQTAKFVKKSV